jgi:hypothetical protein
MTEKGPSLMMIPGDYQRRSRAPSVEPGQAGGIGHEHPVVASGPGVRAGAVPERERPGWARIGVPLAVMFLIMFVAMWVTSLTR